MGRLVVRWCLPAVRVTASCRVIIRAKITRGQAGAVLVTMPDSRVTPGLSAPGAAVAKGSCGRRPPVRGPVSMERRPAEGAGRILGTWAG